MSHVPSQLRCPSLVRPVGRYGHAGTFYVLGVPRPFPQPPGASSFLFPPQSVAARLRPLGQLASTTSLDSSSGSQSDRIPLKKHSVQPFSLSDTGCGSDRLRRIASVLPLPARTGTTAHNSHTFTLHRKHAPPLRHTVRSSHSSTPPARAALLATPLPTAIFPILKRHLLHLPCAPIPHRRPSPSITTYTTIAPSLDTHKG